MTGETLKIERLGASRYHIVSIRGNAKGVIGSYSKKTRAVDEARDYMRDLSDDVMR